MKELTLKTPEGSTPVLVGAGLSQRLNALNNGRIILLADENVLRLHRDKLSAFRSITIPSGESHKTLEYVAEIHRQLVAMEADRSSFLVGVGGGLVSDVAGFVASTFMRGIRFGFISTTLLGQVDASIGGKNGVNLDGYKNMIGVIRQPEFVWCDLDFLETLASGEYLSGMAEVIKYAAIRDKEFLPYLEGNMQALLKREPGVLEETIGRSAGMKIGIVESDVSEMGDRKLLNFGHTFGHAIEKLTGMLHGYAVSIGMVIAADLSVKCGYLERSGAERLRNLLVHAGLPVETDQPRADLYETLLKDKKRDGHEIHFILLRSLGDAFIRKFRLDELKQLIDDLY